MPKSVEIREIDFVMLGELLVFDYEKEMFVPLTPTRH